tara:strand:+ start:281 stop:1003 length:723 start_codon:yes stop_codon:yes gene_type:complete
MNRKIQNPLYTGNGRKTARHFSAGGMLVGPSHDEGGIQAIVDGDEPIEVEGGEFVINKQTVEAVGEEFLHKLNSTETTHHTGGYEEGVLPSPSKFKDGGKVNNRRNEMARGRRRAPRRGTAPARRMARGGRTTGGIKARRGRKMAHGGMACGGMNQPPCHSHSGGYKRGGSISARRPNRPVTSRSLGRGGKTRGRVGIKRNFAVGGQTGRTNNACKNHRGEIGCKNHPGCHWNYSTNMCH